MIKTISVFLFIALVFGAIAVRGSRPSTPIIVAKQSFLAQSAAVPITTVFTPAVEGDFRLSLYIVGTSGTGSACGVFAWTDESSTESVDFGCGAAGPNSAAHSTSPIHATASNPIQFSTFINGTVTYDAFVIVEQMD